MIIVRRWPNEKPKRPKSPVQTTHFIERWHLRTGTPLSSFTRRWTSAQFLGETEHAQWGRKPLDRWQSGRTQFYAIGPTWVVLVVVPAMGGQAKIKTVWHREWFEEEWSKAVANTQKQMAPSAEPSTPRNQEDSVPSKEAATAAAGFACASVEA